MHEIALRVGCLAALLLTGCAERKAGTASPSGDGATAPSSPSSSQCPGGGPSVQVNVRGYAGGSELPSDTLGATLAYVGSFAQPCRELPPKVPQFTLEVTIPEPGATPSFELVDRASLPELAACLDTHFATATAPPPEPMIVEITIPWGCNTLGPRAATTPEADATPEATNEPDQGSA